MVFLDSTVLNSAAHGLSLTLEIYPIYRGRERSIKISSRRQRKFTACFKVLIFAGVELIFSAVAGVGVCFEFVLNTESLL